MDDYTDGKKKTKFSLYIRKFRCDDEDDEGLPVKFLMLFKGSLLPPLTDLLSRLEGSVPQQNASF
jgi:hypothetical protein